MRKLRKIQYKYNNNINIKRMIIFNTKKISKQSNINNISILIKKYKM